MANIKGNLRGKYKCNRLMYGCGTNDASYVTKSDVFVKGFVKSGDRWICPYYRKWCNMLRRAYSKKYHDSRETYKDVEVCEEWLSFSKFREWVDEQPERGWINLSLDKDFLSQGCRVYSPTTAVFIDAKLNNFLLDSGSIRGEYLLGVSAKKGYMSRPYQSDCKDPLKRHSGYLGCYSTELEAHLVWKSKKHEYACELATTQSDSRVADVLRTKYK